MTSRLSLGNIPGWWYGSSSKADERPGAKPPPPPTSSSSVQPSAAAPPQQQQQQQQQRSSTGRNVHAPLVAAQPPPTSKHQRSTTSILQPPPPSAPPNRRSLPSTRQPSNDDEGVSKPTKQAVVVKDAHNKQMPSQHHSQPQQQQLSPSATPTSPTPPTYSFTHLQSSHSAAILYKSYQLFVTKQPRSQRLVRSLIQRKQIDRAVLGLLDDASNSLDDLALQQQLLQAVSYAMTFLQQSNAKHQISNDVLIDRCKILRVLNSLHKTDIYTPKLTYLQYTTTHPPNTIIHELLSRQQHLLAYRICQWLDLDTGMVLMDWAIHKLQTSSKDTATTVNEQQLTTTLLNKLQLNTSLSYTPIANLAFSLGYRQLATQLLQRESNNSSQVSSLLGMNELKMAFTTAVQSGDTDLILFVMLHIVNSTKYNEFIALMKEHGKLAINLYIAYCYAVNDMNELKTFYYHMQSSFEAGRIAAMQAIPPLQTASIQQQPTSMTTTKDAAAATATISDTSTTVAQLRVAIEMYRKDVNDPLSAFATTMTAQEVLLLRILREQHTNDPNVSMSWSIHDLYCYFIRTTQRDKAVSVRNTFKLSESIAWHLEAQTLAAAKRWIELHKLAVSLKSPPISLQAFIDVCVQYHNLPEASKYIDLLTDSHDQMENYCAIGHWVQAAQIAVKIQDMDALQLIRTRCKQTFAQQEIDHMIKKLDQQLSRGQR